MFFMSAENIDLHNKTNEKLNFRFIILILKRWIKKVHNEYNVLNTFYILKNIQSIIFGLKNCIELYD